MLLRTLLALSPESLADRVEGLLDARDVSVFRAAGPDEVWQVLQREDIDLLVAGTSGSPGPTDDWVAAVRAVPGPPTS